MSLTPDRVDVVLRSKVDAAWHLHGVDSRPGCVGVCHVFRRWPKAGRIVRARPTMRPPIRFWMRWPYRESGGLPAISGWGLWDQAKRRPGDGGLQTAPPAASWRCRHRRPAIVRHRNDRRRAHSRPPIDFAALKVKFDGGVAADVRRSDQRADQAWVNDSLAAARESKRLCCNAWKDCETRATRRRWTWCAHRHRAG